MAKASKARVFMSGRSQHVTIPVGFRFRSTEVSIRRDPTVVMSSFRKFRAWTRFLLPSTPLTFPRTL